MKTLFTALLAVAALVGCDTNRENAREAQRELGETQQEAAKNVSEAQGEAVQDVNEAKKEAAGDIRDAQKDVVETQREAARDTASGTTSPTTGELRVTPEQCARFANTKEVKPEDKALYEACSKIDKKSYR